MKVLCTWVVAAAVIPAALLTLPRPAAGQETTVKTGVAVSSFSASQPTYWDDPITTTFFGIHTRLRLGPVRFQPELLIVTKGGTASVPGDAAVEDERMRLEYIEVPLLLVLPFNVGRAEPFIYGGPIVMLESRCRWVFREDGLRNNLGCDPPRREVFRRNAFDYGAAAGAGIAYPVGPGRVSLDARHSWGMRDVHREDGLELRNRTFYFMLGYSVNWQPDR
jgi:hypothetical protein